MYTVKSTFEISGIGLHTGKTIRLRFHPRSQDGIVFRRLDLDGKEFFLKVSDVRARRSAIFEAEGHRIGTLEHLMAVLSVFEISSLVLELDGEEMPAMDGSALPFVHAVEEAGLERTGGTRRVLKIIRPFSIKNGEAELRVSPANTFRIDYSIEFEHPLISRQQFSLDIDRERFIREIAPARTFGFISEVDELIAGDLAKGGSLSNALVLDETGLLNGPLRFPDEFVRHKILDFIGDLGLLRRSPIGKFSAFRAGHSLHLQCVNFLLDHPSYWTEKLQTEQP